MSRSPWRVVAALFLLAFITIVDRVCISAAKNDMAAELGISDLSFGLVFGAFALGYSLSMVPSGWAGDAMGPRRFLTAIVCLWSLLTLATGLARGLPLLIAIRLLFGAAEAGAFPTAARAIYNWMPVRRRGLALGLLNTGSRLGAAAGLAATSFGVERIGWRLSFGLLGAAGFLWAIVWHMWFRDRPAAQVARVDDVPIRAERELSWRDLISVDSAIVLLQYFASNFTFFICFSWLLPYLRSRFGLTAATAGAYAGIPLYFGAVATWSSGLAVDWLYRRGHATISRRAPAIAGFLLAAITLIAASYVRTPLAFVLLFALTTFGVDFTVSPSWTVCTDIGGSRTGTLSGAMNTLGSLGSFSSSVSFPWLLGLTGDIRVYFFGAAALNLMAAAGWWKLRAKAQ